MKDPTRVRTTTLDIPGRNVVVYYTAKQDNEKHVTVVASSPPVQ